MNFDAKGDAVVVINDNQTLPVELSSFTATHDSPGFYQIAWDGRDFRGQTVSSGVYLYRMTSGAYSSTKKMILAK